MTVEASSLGISKATRTYQIIGKQGLYKYARKEGNLRSTKYIFTRSSLKDPRKLVEVSVTEETLRTKVFEIEPKPCQTINAQIDLSKLEAFRYQ